ncbi:MAG: YbaK/EbsC family protein [Clostridia bacterium]|nr:YbaK/EbsC family protein [Clostridia bacterium]
MEKIEDIMKKEGVSFEFIHNDKPIHTAKEGAEYFNISIGQTAATLIIYTDIGFHALVVSGERSRVDFKVVKHIVNCKDVRLATKDEVQKITGFSIGNVPLFGISLPYIVDKKLLQYPFVYGGSGEKNVTLKVNPDALLKLNEVMGILE